FCISEMLLRLLDADAELLELGVGYGRWSVGHEVSGGGGLREGNHFAEAGRTGQQHDDTVESEGYAAVRWRAVAKRFEEESEATLLLFVIHAEGFENLGLDGLLMDSDGARPELHSIEDDVVSPRTHFTQCRVDVASRGKTSTELRHVFFVRRSEWVMRGIPTSVLLIPFEHRKIGDPEKLPVAAFEGLVTSGVLLSQREAKESCALIDLGMHPTQASRLGVGSGLVSSDDDREVAF